METVTTDCASINRSDLDLTIQDNPLGQIHYFISRYKQMHGGYPNLETGVWNYVKTEGGAEDPDDIILIDLDLNTPNPYEPTFEWKKQCDKYIKEFYIDESSFMDHMSTLREMPFTIMPFKDDLFLPEPNVYDLTKCLTNVYIRVEDSFIVLYPKSELECFTSFPQSPTLEEEECLANKTQWKIDFDDLDEEALGSSLDKFLQEYEPDFYHNLVQGDALFFGDRYRNDGYFFFDGNHVVGSVADVPDTHDYGIPPYEIRKYYPFTWSLYGFLN